MSNADKLLGESCFASRAYGEPHAAPSHVRVRQAAIEDAPDVALLAARECACWLTPSSPSWGDIHALIQKPGGGVLLGEIDTKAIGVLGFQMEGLVLRLFSLALSSVAPILGKRDYDCVQELIRTAESIGSSGGCALACMRLPQTHRAYDAIIACDYGVDCVEQEPFAGQIASVSDLVKTL